MAQPSSKFHRKNYPRMTRALSFSMLLTVFLVGILLYWMTHPQEPDYFSTTINHESKPLEALDMPNQSDAAVLQWANQAATSVFTFNFVDYREDLAAASIYFTPEGWREFQTALDNSNVLDEVRSKKLVAGAVAVAVPTVERKGLEADGHYGWRVSMPMLVKYQGAGAPKAAYYRVEMIIKRISTLHSPRGIGIEQFRIARLGKGPIS